MIYHTLDTWDEAVWRRTEAIYEQAFDENRKSTAIIRRMFERSLCRLHYAEEGNGIIATALTGIEREAKLLIIDYLAVHEHYRGRGIGRKLLAYISKWAAEKQHLDAAIIEIEAEPTETNRKRLRFWESCGFTPTSYVHRYIWVPEPYRAMYLPLRSNAPFPQDGETLFRYITGFHRKAYRK